MERSLDARSMRMRRAGWAVWLSAALACAGCHSSSGANDGDGGGEGDLDVNVPPAVFDATVCVEDAGMFSCLGPEWPACAATAQTGATCDDMVATCVGCFENAAYDCVCLAVGQLPADAGSVFAWSCLGTQYTCSGTENRDAAPFFAPGDSSSDDASDGDVGDASDGESPDAEAGPQDASAG